MRKRVRERKYWDHQLGHMGKLQLKEGRWKNILSVNPFILLFFQYFAHVHVFSIFGYLLFVTQISAFLSYIILKCQMLLILFCQD